jgi:hypothetical protein
VNKEGKDIIICSNSLNWSDSNVDFSSNPLRLTYNPLSPAQNVLLDLPHFVESLNCHFPDRIKDLLEIAGYIYAADRLVKRGNPQSLEYHSWSRSLDFHISVRDYEFWSQIEIKELLDSALTYISGDNSFNFSFYSGGTDIGQTNLFDNETISLEKKANSVIALFSGGLDSLAGVLELLETSNKNLILISHRSNNPGITSLQTNLSSRLIKDYPDRIQYYPFYCNLKGERAVEETQRTRIFLYTSIAFALSELASQKEIFVFENGITSINFYKRQDLINARASRTTHPKTLYFLERIFTKIAGAKFILQHPFLYSTKTDIFNKLSLFKKESYINSTVTCTKTFQKFQNNTQATHCGGCSQCVDRRFAAYASNLEEYDAIYDIDISKDAITEPEPKTHLFDYISLIVKFNQSTEFTFSYENTEILSDLIPYIEGQNNISKIQNIFRLVSKHSNQVLYAIKRIASQDNPLLPKRENTLISYIGDRTYLKPPTERLIENICKVLTLGIPTAFTRSKPTNENVLNDQINALLIPYQDEYEREFPGIRYSTTSIIPDHSIMNSNLIIESKLFKPKKALSAITNEIAADIIKYPKENYKLFIVYDPFRRITNDRKFSADFEKEGNTFVHIIR